jgi:hypothetical protein
MEVHPPMGAVHGWRDFFVHLAVITLGLLIALGLEGMVEWARHKHLVHRAEADLKLELQTNRAALEHNSKSLDTAQKEAETDLRILLAYKAHRPPGEELKFYWEWNSLNSAAWDTARDTGATALMNYEKAKQYSETYGQQSRVNLQAYAYIRGLYRSAAPLAGSRKVSALQPAELDGMIASVQQTMVDIKMLSDLSEGLARDFKEAAAFNGH